MNKKYFTKIALGTAQFGMDYGIGNKYGKVSAEEADRILRCAARNGINMLDTASAYGDSEEVIGRFVPEKKPGFRVISKLPTAAAYSPDTVEKALLASLKRLKSDCLYGYLVHSADDFFKDEGIWDDIVAARDKGLIKKAGFSLYTTDDLETLLEKRLEIDIIQCPYSIFDRRFERYFEILKRKNIEVHARSVFLQGLPFVDPYSLTGSLAGAREHILKLNHLSYENGISAAAICLNFVLSNDLVGTVVIGVDSLDQLNANIENIGLAEKISNIKGSLEQLNIQNEDILLPYRWVVK